MRSANAVEHERQVTGLPRVIKSRRMIGLVSTPTENEKIGCPPAPLRLAEKSGDIVGADCSLQAMQEKQTRRICHVRGCIHSIDVNKIAIRCVPTLDAKRHRWTRAKELSP